MSTKTVADQQPEPADDFDAYYGSPDAREASALQLQTLARIRAAWGRPLSIETYASIRAELGQKAVAR
jgi:hypothetical protein